MSKRTEKQTEQMWRSWCLKMICSFRVLMQKIARYCPEVCIGPEFELCQLCLDEMEKKIRERPR